MSIVIPAYNEAQCIGSTLAAVRSWAHDAECIVVDDGSCDETSSMAEQYVDQLIRLSHNCGKGFALQIGWQAAKGDVLLQLDADLAESAGHAWQLLVPVQAGECDMAIAIFPQPEERIGLGLAKGLAEKGIRLLTGFHASAPLSGQRAIRKEVLQATKRLDHGFGVEVGLTVDALRAGYTIKEVPVPFKHRLTQNDWKGYLHRGREFVAVGRALGRKWREGSALPTCQR